MQTSCKHAFPGKNCLCHCTTCCLAMQGRPVGLYIPPPEIQGKVKRVKGNKEMSAPETQLVASGRLASASEADSAEHVSGQFSQHLLLTSRFMPGHASHDCILHCSIQTAGTHMHGSQNSINIAAFQLHHTFLWSLFGNHHRCADIRYGARACEQQVHSACRRELVKSTRFNSRHASN